MDNQVTLAKARNPRRIEGVVVSTNMSKTIVIKVDRSKEAKIYKKRIITSKKFKCHDEKQQAKVGNLVVIQECRPLSKEKRWRLIKIIK